MEAPKLLKSILFVSIILFITSCEKDNPQDLESKNTLVQDANKVLSGETIVLSTKATLGSVDKTLLPQGCPAKFYFEWKEDIQKLFVRLQKFQVGNMPFAVVFYCNTTYSELNTWEKEEYPEAGWIKFYGNDGVVVPYVPKGEEEPVADGAAIITGYFNPKLEEIEFVINYNMMNVITHTFRQKIDKTRIKRFDEEFKKYEEDLKKYKEEHGL